MLIITGWFKQALANPNKQYVWAWFMSKRTDLPVSFWKNYYKLHV